MEWYAENLVVRDGRRFCTSVWQLGCCRADAEGDDPHVPSLSLQGTEGRKQGQLSCLHTLCTYTRTSRRLVQRSSPFRELSLLSLSGQGTGTVLLDNVG